jgi:hypothetical protein
MSSVRVIQEVSGLRPDMERGIIIFQLTCIINNQNMYHVGRLAMHAGWMHTVL